MRNIIQRRSDYLKGATLPNTLAMFFFISMVAISDDAVKELDRESEKANCGVKIQAQDDSAAQEKTTEVEDEMLDKFGEVFSVLKKESPALFEMLAQKKDILISGALGSLDVGISIEENKGPDTEAGTRSVEYFSPVVISSQKVMYVRIDGFSSANFASLREDLEAIMRLRNKPAGVVVDIRNCSGGSIEDALQLFSIFSSNLPPVGYAGGTIPSSRIIKGIPVIILIGKESSGACEIFASWMKSSGHSLLLGENSSGRPFPFVKVPLGDGRSLRIPSIPQDFRGFEYSKIKPSIEMPCNSTVSYKRISEESGAEHEDEVLSRACEFLICMDELRKPDKKHKREKNSP